MNVISCNQSFKIIKLSDSNFAALVIQLLVALQVNY
jgi:hypothetical protein